MKRTSSRTDHAKARAAGWQDPLLPQQPLVKVSWLAGAFTASLLLAAACGYLALCALFYQGSWQLIYHPSRAVPSTPASAGLRFESAQFDDTETGQLLLTGWWIPADHSPLTVLLLHDGAGSLSDTVSLLAELHRTDVNVFAFDYRGFGRSAALHPSERSMNEDADAAWTYLVQTRHLPEHTLVFYGVGTGAAIAADAAQRHSSAAGLVLDQPGLSALDLISRDSRSRMLPVRLLTTDRLEPGPSLAHSALAKLIIDRAPPDSTLSQRAHQLFQIAARPKQFASPPDQDRMLIDFLGALHR